MANEVNSKPYDFEKSQDEIALYELREEVRKVLPPVSEIAQLAALISHGRPIGLQSWENYAQHAINLWEWSHQKREDWINRQANMKLLRAKAEQKEAEQKFPMPKKFPVSFDDYLRLALPKKSPADRIKLYRESIRVSIRQSKCFQPSGNVVPFDTVPISTDEEVANVIARHKATGFDEFQFRFCVGALQNFAEWEQKQNRKKRGKAGAAGKWKEKNSPDEK